MSQQLGVREAPDVGLHLFGFGLAVVATPAPFVRAVLGGSDEPEEGHIFDDVPRFATDPGEPAPSEDDSMQRASQLIRRADAARADRDFVAAEELYRQGVEVLPRDPETRQNLEVPVRVDWARVLVEIGRSDDAREVLEEALAIAPDDAAARALLDELRGPPEEVSEPELLPVPPESL